MSARAHCHARIHGRALYKGGMWRNGQHGRAIGWSNMFNAGHTSTDSASFANNCEIVTSKAPFEQSKAKLHSDLLL